MDEFQDGPFRPFIRTTDSQQKIQCNQVGISSALETKLQDLERRKIDTEIALADARVTPVIPNRSEVRGNRERFQMALLNAIRNAQDATDPDDDVTLTLRHDQHGCAVRIADTGSGMDESFVRERLFKPFDSTKGSEGMGIGAYQLRETVRAMGGEVSVDRRPAEGTRVELRFSKVESAGA